MSMDVREAPCCLESSLASGKLRLIRESTSYPPGPLHLPLHLPLWLSSHFRPLYIRLRFSLLHFLLLPQGPNSIFTARLPLLPLQPMTTSCLVQHLSSVSPRCNLPRSQLCNIAQHHQKLHFPTCFVWWSSSTEVNLTGKF